MSSDARTMGGQASSHTSSALAAGAAAVGGED